MPSGRLRAGRRLASILIILSGSALAALALPVGLSEATSLIASVRPMEHRFVAIVGDSQRSVLSFPAKDDLLTACLTTGTALTTLLRPRAELHRFRVTCRDLARAMMPDMPLYALPHLVDAWASAFLGDLPAFRAALLRNWTLAPHVHWQSDRRLTLVHGQRAGLGTEAAVLLEREISSLLTSREGRRILAQRFLAWPEMRDTITSLAEGATEGQQLHFLEQVKRLAASRRS